MFALWSAQHLRLDHDLQLIAEAVARPGETLAVRALLFEHVAAAQGPNLAVAPVSLHLLDADGRVVAETLLEPRQATQSMEGEVVVPATLRGEASLSASARAPDGSRIECVRPLQIAEDAPLLVAQPRSAGALQTFAVGSVRPTTPDARAPKPFLPRVLGGACPAELRCTLLVWVGEPASAVTVRSSAQVTVPVPSAPSGETAGLVTVEVIPHGLEAQITLEARRQGRLIAERHVRLPVALGEVGVFARASLLEPQEPLQLAFTLPPGREHAIVDVFAGGRWRASESLPEAAASELKLRPELIPSGTLTRVQGRVDRFSSEGAGTRVVYRRAEGESARAALASIARLSGEAATALPSELAEQDVQRAAAFLLAPLELLRLPLPDAYSARPLQIAKLERKRAFLQFGVASVLVLSAILVGGSLMRQGLSAADEARAILDAARGEEGAAAEPASTLRSTRLAKVGNDARLGVILLVCAVALAFLAGALLIVAKPLWF